MNVKMKHRTWWNLLAGGVIALAAIGVVTPLWVSGMIQAWQAGVLYGAIVLISTAGYVRMRRENKQKIEGMDGQPKKPPEVGTVKINLSKW